MVSKYIITEKINSLSIEISNLLIFLGIENKIDLHLRKESRIKSIYSTLAIENNSLSINQVTSILNGKKILGPPKDIHEIQNAYVAYNEIFKLNPYNIKDFLKTHKLMMEGLVKESGNFRSKDVAIYDSLGSIIHIGARPSFVENLIKELFLWGENSKLHLLIKSCIFHFEIEIIHPFLDGNGRMGRIWQNLLLSKWNKLFEWIPIENMIFKNQNKYYEVLNICNKENESTKFIEFMLEIIYESIKEYSNEININKFTDILTPKEKEVYDIIINYLKSNKDITNNIASKLLNKPLTTTRRYILKFVNLGILKYSGENKNRKYFKH